LRKAGFDMSLLAEAPKGLCRTAGRNLPDKGKRDSFSSLAEGGKINYLAVLNSGWPSLTSISHLASGARQSCCFALTSQLKCKVLVFLARLLSIGEGVTFLSPSPQLNLRSNL